MVALIRLSASLRLAKQSSAKTAARAGLYMPDSLSWGESETELLTWLQLKIATEMGSRLHVPSADRALWSLVPANNNQ